MFHGGVRDAPKNDVNQQSSSPRHLKCFMVGSVMLIVLVFCVVVLCVFMLYVPCCDVRYVFRINTMFDSSLHPVVCEGAPILITLFVFVCGGGVRHVFCCVFLRIVCPVFLWIVHF
jgi:hypothetical protein